MIRFDPERPARAAPISFAKAAADLASLRDALRLVDPLARPPGQSDVAAAWDQASQARRRCFAARSERTVAATTTALDALLAERNAGREPNARSIERLADEIRGGLEDLQRLLGR
jgi:hypothetical protein